MDESAHRVGADQTKKPEHQQNDEDCPEHNNFLGLSLLNFALHRPSAEKTERIEDAGGCRGLSLCKDCGRHPYQQAPAEERMTKAAKRMFSLDHAG